MKLKLFSGIGAVDFGMAFYVWHLSSFFSLSLIDDEPSVRLMFVYHCFLLYGCMLVDFSDICYHLLLGSDATQCSVICINDFNTMLRLRYTTFCKGASCTLILLALVSVFFIDH